MKLLLTGATGFLGSHLAQHWMANGHEVHGMRRHAGKPRGSGRDAAQMRWIDVPPGGVPLAREKFDALIHTATCYGRRGEPHAQLIATNVAWPVALIDWAAGTGIPLFLNADTCLPPTSSPYALSKHHAVQWLEILSAGGVRIANLRLHSLYGPGDDESKFPTRIIHACVRNEACLPMTPGDQVRDFLFIDDAVRAFDAVLNRPPSSAFHTFDVGTGTGHPLRSFAEEAKRLALATTRLDFGAVPYRGSEPMRLVADPRGLCQLGWRPLFDLEAGLRQTIKAERQSLPEAFPPIQS